MNATESPARRCLKYLLIGVTLHAPIVISLWIVVYVYGALDQVFEPVLRVILGAIGFEHSGWLRPISNVLSAILSLFVIAIVGYFTSTRIGRWLHEKFDWVYEKFNPVYGPIKKTVKLTMDSIGSDGGLFSRVVLVKGLAQGGYMFGLLHTESEADFVDKKKPWNTHLSVFVIHGPVGNSGFSMVVPKGSLRRSTITVTEFLTTVNLRFGAGAAALWRNQTPN